MSGRWEKTRPDASAVTELVPPRKVQHCDSCETPLVCLMCRELLHKGRVALGLEKQTSHWPETGRQRAAWECTGQTAEGQKGRVPGAHVLCQGLEVVTQTDTPLRSFQPGVACTPVILARERLSQEDLQPELHSTPCFKNKGKSFLFTVVLAGRWYRMK